MTVVVDSKREVVRSFGIQEFMTLRKLIGARERPTAQRMAPRPWLNFGNKVKRSKGENVQPRAHNIFHLPLHSGKSKRNDKKKRDKK